METNYRRVLLKVSGGALSGDEPLGFNFTVLTDVCRAIVQCAREGVQVAIVCGGGNIWRGREGGGMDHSRADQMGMLATVINSLALQDTLLSLGADARVMTAFEMGPIGERYRKERAVHHLEQGRIVILAGGTGNPYFSTDTAAALRAAELGADAILLAKAVDGVYDSDPAKNPDAKRFDRLSFEEVLARKLGVMDLTATVMCMEQDIPLLVFELGDGSGIIQALQGQNNGTMVSNH